MFIGQHRHTIDAKGRVSIPVKFREVLSEQYDGDLIVTRDFDRCLVLYPREEWQILFDKLKKAPGMAQESKEFMRFYLSGASDCALDRQGRVLIPGELRAYAGIAKEVVMIGMHDRIELWSPATWREREEEGPKNRDRIMEKLTGFGI